MAQKKPLPLISCVCITKNRPDFLYKAIVNFKNQSFSNKELIVVFEHLDLTTRRIVTEINDTTIIPLIVNSFKELTLGALRNLGIESANGDYICQWDDDDWYHADRLKLQYEAAIKSGLKGSILTRWIIYNNITKKTYVSESGLKEGTILCEKEIMINNPYPNKRICEDTEVVFHLFDSGFLSPINDSHKLYIYVIHGQNTWDTPHFDEMISFATPLPATSSNQIQLVLDKKHPLKTDSLIIDDLIIE